jgi:hypothetical protein
LQADTELLREIETLVAEEVARFGVAGEVRIVGNSVVLEGYGPPSGVDLGGLIDQWDQLPHEVRARRATGLARRLVEARRASVAPLRSSARGLSMPRFVAPALILALGAGGVWAAYKYLTPGTTGGLKAADHATDKPAGSSVPADEYESERLARAERVCQTTRERVQRGATVGPTDTEGWVVELTLLRAGGNSALTFDPALASFIERRAGSLEGKFVWAGAPEIGARSGPDTKVLVEDASIPAPDQPRLYGVTLRFTGRYVISYFTEAERIAYHKTAHTLAQRLGADFAGLFAQCAQSATHQIGSWFWGGSPAGAAASVIYFMGAHADPVQIEQKTLFPRGGDSVVRSAALLRIAEETAELKRERVLRLLGNTGGMIAGRPNAPHVISFPYKDSNRASRASLDLAREVDIAVTN